MEKKSDLLRLLIGWREWVELPDLSIPHIKAKVDTGARTSALHAFKIERSVERGSPIVQFSVHPIQGRNDIIVQCQSPLIDHRVVSDSGGHRERRYVIETMLSIGGLDWPIEVTLANRETMSFRMLLGRSAMKYLQIEPTKYYLLGRPKSPLKAYKKHRKPR
jgi:hypothetical protein